jgi:nucleoside-diphosphate-sugar epimerase
MSADHCSSAPVQCRIFMKILITGASGFIGSTLLAVLAGAKRQLVVATRKAAWAAPSGITSLHVDDIGEATNWRPALAGIDTIVHLAARVHVMRDTLDDPLAGFRRVNVDGTLNLARQAAEVGVARFIFLSSVKVNGEATGPGRPFRSSDPAAPVDAYGISKHEAEQGLRALGETSAMTVASIRPPLVYGPGVRANFLRLMALVDRGLPLPFGGIRNARSLVSVWNLCDLIRTMADAPRLRPGIFMVSDGEDLSTPELVRRIAKSMQRPARVFRFPVPLLKSLGRLAGKAGEIGRLCDSLLVDMSATRRELNWTPPMSVDQSLQSTARWYLNEGAGK